MEEAVLKALFVGAVVAVSVAFGASAQTVILVRHAEKVDQSADPALSAAGQARAEALALAVADAGLDRVLATPLARTRDTAAPAALASRLAVTPISLDGGVAAHVARVVAAIREASESDTVLVVGHSNTVPEIARALGQARPEVLKDCDYDRLVVLRLAPTGATVISSRYGTPSAPC